jgi:hypothetical protein
MKAALIVILAITCLPALSRANQRGLGITGKLNIDSSGGFKVGDLIPIEYPFDEKKNNPPDPNKEWSEEFKPEHIDSCNLMKIPKGAVFQITGFYSLVVGKSDDETSKFVAVKGKFSGLKDTSGSPCQNNQEVIMPSYTLQEYEPWSLLTKQWLGLKSAHQGSTGESSVSNAPVSQDKTGHGSNPTVSPNNAVKSTSGSGVGN